VTTLKRINNDDVAYQMGHGHQAAFSPNGNLLAIVNNYGLDIWDVTRLVKVHEVRDLYIGGVQRMDLMAVAFGPDGRTVDAGDQQGHVGLWDALTGETLGKIGESDSRAEITALAFTPDGKTLLSAG